MEGAWHVQHPFSAHGLSLSKDCGKLRTVSWFLHGKSSGKIEALGSRRCLLEGK